MGYMPNKPRRNRFVQALPTIAGATLTAAAGVAVNRVEGKWWIGAIFFIIAAILTSSSLLIASRGSASLASATLSNRRLTKARQKALASISQANVHLQDPWGIGAGISNISIPAKYVDINQGIRLITALRAGESIELSGASIEIYEKCDGKLLVLGNAGAGKTRYTAQLHALLAQQANQDEQKPLPFFVNIARWALLENKQSFEEWLLEELSIQTGIRRDYFSRWLADSDMTFILDGLDELSRQQRAALIREINVFLDENDFINVIISCRTKEYMDTKEKLHLSGCIELKPLRVQSMLTALRESSEQNSGLYERAQNDSNLRSLLCTPLFLRLSIYAYRERPAQEINRNEGAWQAAIIDEYLERVSERIVQNGQGVDSGLGSWMPRLATMLRRNNQSVFYPDRLPLEIAQADDMPSIKRKAKVYSAAIALGIILAIRIPILLSHQEEKLFWTYAISGTVPLLALCIIGPKVTTDMLNQPATGRRHSLQEIIPRIFSIWIIGYIIMGGFAAAITNFPSGPFLTALILGSLANAFYPAIAFVRASRMMASEVLPSYPGQEVRSIALSLTLCVASAIAMLCCTLFSIFLPWSMGNPEAFPFSVWEIVPYFITPFIVIIGFANGGADLVARYASLRHLQRTGKLPKKYFKSFESLRRSSIIVPSGGGFEFIHSLVRDHLIRNARTLTSVR